MNSQPPRPVVFSFDIEEHHRIEAAVGYDCPGHLRDHYAQRMDHCTRWILEMLAEANAKATFYIVGEIAQSHPELIRAIAQGGHEIGSHSWDHRRVHRFTPATFLEDLKKSKDILEQVSGQPCYGFRAPTFSITPETAWGVDVLIEAGFRYDSSIFPVKHDRYGIPQAPRVPFWLQGAQGKILELPPATYHIRQFNLPAAGGGYFRLFPIQVMRLAVAQLQRESEGLPMLYFHPWEFDPHQPQLPLKRLSKFRTYVGIPRSRGRLTKLVKQYGSETAWESAKHYLQQGESLSSFSIPGKA